MNDALLLLAAAGLVAVTTSCSVTPALRGSSAGEKTLADHQRLAAKFDNVLELPRFETTPAEIALHVEQAIRHGDRGLDRIAALDTNKLLFANTIGALDDLEFETGRVARRVYLLKETSPDAGLRRAATEAVKKFEDWSVGVRYREDVYRVIEAYAETKPELEGERAKLFEETLRDYRRDGLALPKAERDEVERLKKELAAISTDFDTRVTEATSALTFTREELAGVSEDFLNMDAIKTGDDEYTVMANVTWQFVTVMENASNEETRRRLKVARYSLAPGNADLLNRIVRIRAEIADRLGYDSWADYQIEPRMAKNGATATHFLRDLKEGLEPKFRAEIEEFRKLKIAETGDADAQINVWDWRYYSNQLKKEKYTVDTEQLRVFFPYQQTLEGMFDIYERIFQLRIEELEPPQKWVDDLAFYVVSDSRTGEPLGGLYLDMFPREGKYNHFAQFGIIPGKRLSTGDYQRPVVALICNFPSPTDDKPSLLSHSEVETLFHEFGHALHSILTRANFAGFSGTSVPRDFVEAPSQMLENWIWDKPVLDSFAADYRDPEKKIPESILQRMEEARLATIGTFYRRQLSFGLLDLHLHRARDANAPVDAVAESNPILSEAFFPVPDGTHFVTYFGHLTGYDAGYYGYAWADSIAADMNTVFENAPDRYFDVEAGMKLRNEIYAPGDSRDVNESIREFLGRERSLDPFLESIGLGK